MCESYLCKDISISSVAHTLALADRYHAAELKAICLKFLAENLTGILAKRDQKHHMEALNSHGIGTFDVVVVNLYPFYDKVSSSSGISFEDGIEKCGWSGLNASNMEFN
ncbi:hypothetical protein ACS0TY_031780 [Phlomoides rotata]